MLKNPKGLSSEEIIGHNTTMWTIIEYLPFNNFLEKHKEIK